MSTGVVVDVLRALEKTIKASHDARTQLLQHVDQRRAIDRSRYQRLGALVIASRLVSWVGCVCA